MLNESWGKKRCPREPGREEGANALACLSIPSLSPKRVNKQLFTWLLGGRETLLKATEEGEMISMHVVHWGTNMLLLLGF